MRKSIALAVVLMGVAGVAGAAAGDGPELDGYERFVNEDGSFRFSREATRELQHLGSWFVPSGDAAGFHHVYTQPEAIDAYRETGAFPDGTALVKEIVQNRRANYTTGNDVAVAAETRQWFLMVKDARGRFETSPLWGNGWGWALFADEDPTRNTATDFEADCLGCHIPARRSDWVYTEGYPALRAKQAARQSTPGRAGPALHVGSPGDPVAE